MKMLNFNIGDKVVVIENNELKRGIIKDVHNELINPVAIIDFGTTIEKVSIDNIAPDIQEDKQEEQTENKPVMKSEITITPDQFRETAVKVSVDESEGKFEVGLAFTLFAQKLSEVLFSPDSEF